MSEVLLTGLRARTPIGFLAALGAFRHASKMSDEFSGVRLRWIRRGGEWIASFVTERDVNEEALLTAFVSRVCGMSGRPEFEWADQIKKNTPEKFRNNAEENPSCLDWFSAFGSELAVSNDNTLKSTDFDMTGGPQRFLLKLREASAALARSPKEAKMLLREAIFGPWLYEPSKKAVDTKNSHSMGLDPSTLLQGAFTAEAPTNILDKRGVRGAIWLAFEALPLFPCVVSDGWLRTTGFRRIEGSGWKNHFEWGVWERPLPLSAVQILLSQSPKEWTRSRGISERFRSERVNLNKDYYSLGSSELVIAEQP